MQDPTNNSPTTYRFLSVQQVKEIVSLSVSTIWERAKQGTFPRPTSWEARSHAGSPTRYSNGWMRSPPDSHNREGMAVTLAVTLFLTKNKTI